jgi:hypothetical protein
MASRPARPDEHGRDLTANAAADENREGGDGPLAVQRCGVV